jgi:hypothetical protein
MVEAEWMKDTAGLGLFMGTFYEKHGICMQTMIPVVSSVYL